MIRIGLGYDSHRLEEGLPLILGGVSIKHYKGFVAHSDGDALVHAIIDAILGAAALGNIGQHFPDTDPAYKRANSIKLLEKTVQLLEQSGYSLVNIDSNIIAQQPKLNPHIDAMRTKLANTMGICVDAISIKAKTSELVGPEGREESISTQAIVLIESHG